jgi:hypothetical protein
MSERRGMARRTKRTSFWSTVPGMLSAAAGLLGATAAVLGAMASLGWLGGSDEETDAASMASSLNRVRLHYVWRATPASTSFPQLDMKSVPADSRVTLSCTPQECPRRPRDRYVREATPNFSFSRPLVRIRTGATLEIRFTNARVGTKIWAFTATRAAQPTFEVSCIRLDDTVPASC